jgi:hypothetical protein
MVDQWTNAAPNRLADEISGSLAARQALGPDSEDAVIEAFLQRTGQAIDARVQAQLAAERLMRPGSPAGSPGGPKPDHRPFALAIVSLLAAIPITAICTQIHPSAFAIIVALAAIVVLNVVYNVHNR